MELLISFVKKYKLDVDDQENPAEVSQETGEISRPLTRKNIQSSDDDAMSHRKGLLAELADCGNEQPQLQPISRTLREEIESYFEESRTCGWDTEVLKWWGTNEGQYPKLSKLSRLVLAVPATSAASESAFSFGGCVITARRSSISPFNASQVLFVHDNFELIQKYLLD